MVKVPPLGAIQVLGALQNSQKSSPACKCYLVVHVKRLALFPERVPTGKCYSQSQKVPGTFPCAISAQKQFQNKAEFPRNFPTFWWIVLHTVPILLSIKSIPIFLPLDFLLRNFHVWSVLKTKHTRSSVFTGHCPPTLNSWWCLL